MTLGQLLNFPKPQVPTLLKKMEVVMVKISTAYSCCEN